MKRSILAVALAAAAMTFGSALHAQKTTQVHAGKGGSPHVKTDWTVDGANISITYGKPSLTACSNPLLPARCVHRPPTLSAESMLLTTPRACHPGC